MSMVCEDFDLAWVTSTNKYLKSQTDVNGIPKLYRKAWMMMHKSGLGDVVARGAFYSADGVVKFDGLTNELKRVFHPYTQEIISTGGMATGGSSRGNKVDAELAALVNEGKLPHDQNILKYSLKTAREMKKNHLLPFMAQIPVGDRRSGIATALDYLCIDTSIDVDAPDYKSNLVNVQVKTGFDRNYFKHKDFMQSPFEKNELIMAAEFNYANQHDFQVKVEHVITQLNYGAMLAYSVIMVISEHAHMCYRLGNTPRDISLATAIYKELLRRYEKHPVKLQTAAIELQYIKKALLQKKAKLVAAKKKSQ